MLLPSKLGYTISSGVPTCSSEKRDSLTRVRRRGAAAAAVSRTKRSPISVGVEIDEGEPAAVRRRVVGDDFLVAGRERIDLPGGGVDALQVRAPVIGGAHEDGLAVAAPDRARGQAAAGRALVAGERRHPRLRRRRR